MKKISCEFDNELFVILIEEFRTKFNISTNFGDYNKIREVINCETKEEEQERIGYKNRYKTGEKDEDKLSEDTIKRAFGIINSKKNSDSKNRRYSPTTCNIIARKLGYRGWDDFYEKSIQKYDMIKGFKTINMYEFGSLIVNQDICIGWYPNKYCILKYLGDYSFMVVESYNLRSSVNRVFETTGFIHGTIKSKIVYPDIIIEPILDDDPDWEFIKMDIIPQKYLL